jgi:hypothetical protein
MEDMRKRKMKYAGHVLRGSCGLSDLHILESRLEGKRKVSGPRRNWMKDTCEGRSMDKYAKGKKNCGGKRELVTNGCQPSIRSRQINENDTFLP